MRRVYFDIWTYKRMVAYGNIGSIEKCAVGIDKDMFAKSDTVAVVAMKRRENNR